MAPGEFEKLVDDVVVNLPKTFREKIENAAIVVEMWPSAQIAKGRLLLGLYQGVPKTVWGRSYVALPDKITIFQGPIEFLSRGDENKIKELVVDTVWHEIAHHFGISDARIDEIKKEKA